MRNYHLAPSILSADFSRLGEQVETCLKCGCKYVHIDIMDGNFVDNISIGPAVSKSLKPIIMEYDGVMDVHLMIEHPDKYIDDFVESGADIITVHVESIGDPKATIKKIRSSGVSPGITLKPDTHINEIGDLFTIVDLVLVMSVNPGFGGQSFIPEMLNRIQIIRGMLDEMDLEVQLEVDGGIKNSNVEDVINAGANIAVAGSAIFNDYKKIADNIADLKMSK